MGSVDASLLVAASAVLSLSISRTELPQLSSLLGCCAGYGLAPSGRPGNGSAVGRNLGHSVALGGRPGCGLHPGGISGQLSIEWLRFVFGVNQLGLVLDCLGHGIDGVKQLGLFLADPTTSTSISETNSWALTSSGESVLASIGRRVGTQSDSRCLLRDQQLVTSFVGLAILTYREGVFMAKPKGGQRRNRGRESSCHRWSW